MRPVKDILAEGDRQMLEHPEKFRFPKDEENPKSKKPVVLYKWGKPHRPAQKEE